MSRVWNSLCCLFTVMERASLLAAHGPKMSPHAAIDTRGRSDACGARGPAHARPRFRHDIWAIIAAQRFWPRRDLVQRFGAEIWCRDLVQRFGLEILPENPIQI